MSDYDNTNTAAIFTIDHDKSKLVGAGKWDDEGSNKRIVLVKETYPDGNEHRELYVKVGRLYENNITSENSPKYSGPISTDRGEKRIACWQKETARGTVLSMKIEEKRQPALPEKEEHVDEEIDDRVPF